MFKRGAISISYLKIEIAMYKLQGCKWTFHKRKFDKKEEKQCEIGLKRQNMG